MATHSVLSQGNLPQHLILNTLPKIPKLKQCTYIICYEIKCNNNAVNGSFVNILDPPDLRAPQAPVLRGPHEPRRPVRHHPLLPRPHHWRPPGKF